MCGGGGSKAPASTPVTPQYYPNNAKVAQQQTAAANANPSDGAFGSELTASSNGQAATAKATGAM